MVALFRGVNPFQDRIWRFGCSQGSVCERRVVCNFPKSDQIRLKWGQIGLNSTKMRGVFSGFADYGGIRGQGSGVRKSSWLRFVLSQVSKSRPGAPGSEQ